MRRNRLFTFVALLKSGGPNVPALQRPCWLASVSRTAHAPPSPHASTHVRACDARVWGNVWDNNRTSIDGTAARMPRAVCREGVRLGTYINVDGLVGRKLLHGQQRVAGLHREQALLRLKHLRV